MDRIVVTGVGCVSALGNDFESFTGGLEQGRCGIGEISGFDPDGFSVRIAAEAGDFPAADLFENGEAGQMDRFAQFAVASAREAVSRAGLDIGGASPGDRTAVVFGTGVGGQVTQDEQYLKLYGENARRLHPFTVPKLMPSAAASQVSMDLGITGPVFGTISACASSAHAIATGVLLLRAGLADAAIAGGSEASITPGSIRGWEGLRIMAKDTCRPFSSGRGGMVLGEGGAALVLETGEAARARGAPILAELAGIGMNADAGNLVRPDPEGMAGAIRLALADAGLQPEEIEYINAHGTGTALNDPLETRAIHDVFGEHAGRLAVSSGKSMFGHTLGASGALEAAATVAALDRGFLPPTIGYLGRDPDCDLDYVPNEARRKQPIGVALSHSFAFGGLNAVLAFRRGNGA